MKTRIIFFILIGWTLSLNSLVGQNKTKLSKGDIAYDFTETDDQGNKISLADYKGRAVLINFTATYYGPCWYTYNQMNELQNKYPDKLKIISFHMDEEKEKWKRMAEERSINFEVTSIWESDTKKELFDLYQANGFPYYVLIDDKGVVKKMWFGNSEKKLKRNLRKVVKKIE